MTGWEVPPKKRPFRGSKRFIRIESNYYYDPFGRRLWKEVGGVRTYFVYADEGLVAEIDAAGNVVKSYGYKPGSTWTTDPLFMKVGGNYYFYQNDHLGTPQKLTAVNGAVVWSTKYSSFGEAGVDTSSSITNNLVFAGQYSDQETGLHYNRHRYYGPASGRYLRSDPIGMNGGINLYVYVLNNPINTIDPLGLQQIDIDPYDLDSDVSALGDPWADQQVEEYTRGVINEAKTIIEFWQENPTECGTIVIKCSFVVIVAGVTDEMMDEALKQTAKTLASRGLKVGAKRIVGGVIPFYNVVSGAVTGYQVYKCVATHYSNRH